VLRAQRAQARHHPKARPVNKPRFAAVVALSAGLSGLAFAAPVNHKPKAIPLTACRKSDFPAKRAAKPVNFASGVWIQTLTVGHGPQPKLPDTVVVNYSGTLRGGNVFDASDGAVFPVGGLIPGFTEGLMQMQSGGHYRLCIPADRAYGARSPAPDLIPNNALLIFDVTLVEIRAP
jgi:FKBP-type peptidyl-prolyl cis-trans isomerase FkpA